ncbi:iron-containing alcohol dehydrogenase-domain containing protein, partial [Blyttiomyces helicus]
MSAPTRAVVHNLMGAVASAAARCPCHSPVMTKVVKSHAPGCKHDHHHQHKKGYATIKEEDVEYAFEMATSNIRYGTGVTKEVGMDMRNLKAKKVAVFTDSNIAKLRPSLTVVESLTAAGVPFVFFDKVRVEPTDESFKEAIDFVRREQPDSFIAVGGGSVIDTAKAANLYLSHPEAEFLDFVN